MAKRDGTVAKIRNQLETLCDRDLQRLGRDARAGVRDLVRREQTRRQAAAAERERLACMLTFERELWGLGLTRVAGIDEVGVGPLAGPVVAAAVILPPDTSIDDIDDSKQLDAPTRERLAAVIRERAVAYAVASCSVAEIDTLNIYHASCEAMRRAVTRLGVTPEHLLVDARRVPGVATPQTSIIEGDGKSQSIAAASILAKVERDALMTELARAHPGYGFERHKGYATAEHFDALQRLGACALHRRSFGPVALAHRQGELARKPRAQPAQGRLFATADET